MNYFKGVAQEMKKVTWPKAGEVNHFTWLIIFMIVFFGLYFALSDFASTSFMDWFVNL